MSKYIGKLVNVGYGVESTRGTPVAVSHRQPKTNLTFQDMLEHIIDENSIGNVVDAHGADIVKKWSEGAIEGRVYVNALGYILYSLLGTCNTASSGGAYVHTFTLNNSNTHKSLTIGMEDPDNETRFALAMLESLTLDITNAGELTFSATFKGKASASTTHTVSYATDYGLLGKHAVVKLATNLAGLGAAAAMDVKSFSITFSKNLEMDYVLGDVEPGDIYNTVFSIEGNIEAILNDVADYKDVAFADTAKALRITVDDANTIIGTSETPGIEIDLAKVKLTNWTANRSNSEIVKQTIQFKGLYSMSDTQAVTIDLTNTTTSY